MRPLVLFAACWAFAGYLEPAPVGEPEVAPGAMIAASVVVPAPVDPALSGDILRMLVTWTDSPSPRWEDRAVVLDRVIRDARKLEGSALDPLLVAAVAVNESGGRQDARGARGEVGFMQIKPDGAGAIVCRDLRLLSGLDNVRCGLRLLERARAACGGEPATWLGSYTGRRCGLSPYATRVLGVLSRARVVVGAN